MTREDVPSNEMILERARQASKDLRKRFKEDLEQEPCDEYGNYKYPGDIELPEPNTATSMPCGDAISRQAMHIELEKWITYGEYKYSNATKYLYDRIDKLPSVNPQEPVLDKIRAEIIQIPTISFNANDVYKADVLQIIDKYRAESEKE